MKKYWLYAGALVASGVMMGTGLVLEPVQAQQGGGSSIRMAVIDVNEVFKKYDKYKTLTDAFRGEVEKTETELRSEEQLIRSKMEQVKSLKSPADRERVEREINELQFGFEQKRRKLQAEFVRKETDIMNTIYKELSDLVGNYCKQHSFHMVFRIRKDTTDSSPQAVVQTMNREVVYFHPNLDLTDVIADGLNQLMK